eukprot:350255-Chlamydomonas_euryale.AAC.39
MRERERERRCARSSRLLAANCTCTNGGVRLTRLLLTLDQPSYHFAPGSLRQAIQARTHSRCWHGRA